MKVLFDTNVILDVLMERTPHAQSGLKLFALVHHGRLNGSLSATTITTIYYLASKKIGKQKTESMLRELLELFDIATVEKNVINAALHLNFDDFEDAVLHEAARAMNADAIVTRDRKGFARATIPTFTPEELLALIAISKQ